MNTELPSGVDEKDVPGSAEEVDVTSEIPSDILDFFERVTLSESGSSVDLFFGRFLLFAGLFPFGNILLGQRQRGF